LGYRPTISLEDGIEDFINWTKTLTKTVQDNSRVVIEELKDKGLLK